MLFLCKHEIELLYFISKVHTLHILLVLQIGGKLREASEDCCGPESAREFRPKELGGTQNIKVEMPFPKIISVSILNWLETIK